MKQLIMPLVFLFAGNFALAAVEMGKPLPEVDIPSRGELVVDGDNVRYAAWSTDQIREGVPVLLFHIPARMSSDAIMKPLQDRLEAEDSDPAKHQAVSVINLGDALWGTSGLVAGELEKKKREHPEAVMVADDDSRALKAWGLKTKTVTVMIYGVDGKLIYRHDGPMDASDIDEILSTLKAQIALVK